MTDDEFLDQLMSGPRAGGIETVDEFGCGSILVVDPPDEVDLPRIPLEDLEAHMARAEDYSRWLPNPFGPPA